MQTSPSLSKVWFVVSIALLTFLYGTAVGKWEWFPHSFLNQAMDQARVLQGQVMERDSTDGIIMYDRVYGRVGTRVLEPEKMKPGLVLVSSQWEDDDGWDSELRIIDRKGKVLHRWEIDREKVFQGGISQRRQPTETSVHGSHLSENGDVFVNLSYVGMIKINSCGDVVWELGEGNHHGMTQADDGSFWTPAVSDNRRTSTPAYPNGFPGLDEPIWMDQLLHISENGDVIDRINLLDVLKKNGLADHIVKGSKYNYKDPLHINDVNYLSKSISNEYPLFGEGDMLLSLRNPNLLLVLEPKKK